MKRRENNYLFKETKESINNKKRVVLQEMKISLSELGLNKYEERVYLTLVAEGISTAKNVSDITGIPYGKVYEVMNSLANKGFLITLPTKPMKCQAVSPKKTIINTKKKLEEKFDRIEKDILKKLEPMFAQSKKFITPKAAFWVINGRSNVVDKTEELISKASKHINILTSENGLKRLVMHKEPLKEAKKRGVNINIAATLTQTNKEDLEKLKFCNISNVEKPENHLLSIDGKECLIIEPIVDDENIIYGRDLGMWVLSQSFTKLMENFYNNQLKN